MPFKSYREESRREWGRDLQTRNLTDDEVKVGALLRVADAIEKIASDRETLERQLKNSEKSLEWYRKQLRKAEASRNALRGVITKMKRKGGE
jgi:septal ring factor EnvC (AmiA/AmiB activator)